ncbi:MAG: hypothetical protein CSA15_06315 [Candidatus Delongbacteria bacterium]|nr:MAG: hypothetical protein CSA15_06315 [Candidatus Delongbacteria bacterium]
MQKIIYLLGVLILLASCHLDEPTKPDTKAPSGEFIGMLADGDTLIWKKGEELINYSTNSPYVNNEIMIIDTINNYDLVFNIHDSGELFQSELFAHYNGNDFLIKEFTPANGLNSVKFNIADLGELSLSNGIFDIDYKLNVSDESENSVSISLPVVQTAIPTFMNYFQMGVPNLYSLKIEEDQLVKREVLNSYPNQSEKLILMQFHANMCPNCCFEEQHLQEFYSSEEFDPEKVYIGTFFSSPLGYDEFKGYIEQILKGEFLMAGVVPEFDHFFDGIDGEYSQNVKKHFGVVDNDLLAIFPNGDIEKYNSLNDFDEWISEMLTKYEAMK